MGNAPSTSGQVSGQSHVPGDDSRFANTIREQRPEHLRILDTDNEEEVDESQSIDMEVPNSHISYICTEVIAELKLGYHFFGPLCR